MRVNVIGRLLWGAGFAALVLTSSAAARGADVLRSVSAIPAHISGRFREPVGFQQAASGEYFVFDRRAHAVYGIDSGQANLREVARIGAESGRIIDPTAFGVAPDSSFVVADAPNGRERIQIFTPGGSHLGGFLLPGRVMPRVVLNGAVMNGIGSLQYTGTSILLSQPETGGLFNEYDLNGGVNRTIGTLRATGHENDREVHLALNSGVPLVDPTGGFYFVFQTGAPLFRKYDRAGRFMFERHIEGREIDAVVATLPTEWPKRRTTDGEMPLVLPTIRTAAVDRAGNLWISFVIPFTYVYDTDGDKTRALQFRGAGIIAPNSLFFAKNGRLLVTPGLYEFDPRSGQASPAPVPPILPIPPIPPILPLE